MHAHLNTIRFPPASFEELDTENIDLSEVGVTFPSKELKCLAGLPTCSTTFIFHYIPIIYYIYNCVCTYTLTYTLHTHKHTISALYIVQYRRKHFIFNQIHPQPPVTTSRQYLQLVVHLQLPWRRHGPGPRFWERSWRRGMPCLCPNPAENPACYALENPGKWDEMRAGHVSVGLWIVWIGRKLKTDETGNGVPFFPHIYVGERNQLSQVATQMFSPNPPCYSSERWVCLKCWFLNVSKLSTLVFL